MFGVFSELSSGGRSGGRRTETSRVGEEDTSFGSGSDSHDRLDAGRERKG
jgi:hypothetical protein